MSAPTFPPAALTRSKVGRRLRDAHTRVKEAQRPHKMRGPATLLLLHVWSAIEQAEAAAMAEVNNRLKGKR